MGTTRPLKEVSHDGRLLRVDLHYQGTWSAQLAVLGVLAELAAAGSGAGIMDVTQSGGQSRSAPALMFITGHGLKKGWAPLRETVWTMLKNMGMSVRVAVGNGGTLIVPNWDVQRAVRLAWRRGWSFDVTSCFKFLVDARRIVEQQDEDEEPNWGRVDVRVEGEEVERMQGMASVLVAGSKGGTR